MSKIRRSAQFIFCGFVFVLALVAEVYLIAPLVSIETLTTKRINDFLLVSMGLAFLPLLLAVALVPVLVGLLLVVAYAPARICWIVISPRVRSDPSPRVRMLKRMEELKRMPPERERDKHASKPDASELD